MTQAGYKYLKTYQLATVIYDLTVEFCEKFLPGFDYRRTREQMIQSARSGKQNIAEGYQEKSLKGYIKLLGVAYASLEELLEDYQDFLRQRRLQIWDKAHPKIREFREFRVFWDFQDRQIKSLEEKFVQEGGYTEKLFRQRLKVRSKTKEL